MLIDTLNARFGGQMASYGPDYLDNQHMRRFVFRNQVVPEGEETQGDDEHAFVAGSTINPTQAAAFHNAVQEHAEGSRLGIPALFKSNARNHIDPEARPGINESAGAFTAFPKEAGLAAAVLGADGDTGLIEAFARVMGAEWRAIGLRGMYGYMVDLITEPRWYRAHECFSQDAELTSQIVRRLIGTLQGTHVEDGVALSPDSDILLTIKHFPGGGPQELGLDPHYSFGKTQVYPGGRFAEHLRPFEAAIQAGAASIMPYYGVPRDVTHAGVDLDEIGMAFNDQIVNGLLRRTMGFAGYVNSDTGIITDRAWGLEERTVPERTAAAVNSGVLPLPAGAKVYVLGAIDPTVVASYGFEVIDGNVGAGAPRPSAADADVVLMTLTARVHGTDAYRSAEPTSGMRPDKTSPIVFPGVRGLDGTSPFGAADAGVAYGAETCTDDKLLFGGSFPWESSDIDFTGMAAAESWQVVPSLSTVQEVMRKVGDPSKVVLDVYFRQPFVLDEDSGLRSAGAIVATFGITDEARMDVLSGRVAPTGRLPFALPATRRAVETKQSDVPGYGDDELFGYGHGLSY